MIVLMFFVCLLSIFINHFWIILRKWKAPRGTSLKCYYTNCKCIIIISIIIRMISVDVRFVAASAGWCSVALYLCYQLPCIQGYLFQPMKQPCCVFLQPRVPLPSRLVRRGCRERHPPLGMEEPAPRHRSATVQWPRGRRLRPRRQGQVSVNVVPNIPVRVYLLLECFATISLPIMNLHNVETGCPNFKRTIVDLCAAQLL